MAAHGVERRRQRRYEMPTAVVLKVITGDRFQTSRLEDISLGGACVRLKTPIDSDQKVELAHPKIGRIRGTCVWAKGDRMGYRFDKGETSLELFAHCMKLLVPAPRHF